MQATARRWRCWHRGSFVRFWLYGLMPRSWRWRNSRTQNVIDVRPSCQVSGNDDRWCPLAVPRTMLYTTKLPPALARPPERNGNKMQLCGWAFDVVWWSSDRFLTVDPFTYFSFQPVLHVWCNKDLGICFPVCGMVHIKEPLVLIKKSSLCSGGNGVPLSLTKWSFTIRSTPYNRK